MIVKLTNLKTNKDYTCKVSSKKEAEDWIKRLKDRGKDEKIMFSPSKIEGAKVIGEQKGPTGITYKLKFPADYIVEYLEYDERDVERNWKEFKAKIKEILVETDYTQLPDVPISTEQRRIYRAYREYIRNKKNDYKDENIHTWKILTFEEFRQMKFPK